MSSFDAVLTSNSGGLSLQLTLPSGPYKVEPSVVEVDVRLRGTYYNSAGPREMGLNFQGMELSLEALKQLGNTLRTWSSQSLSSLKISDLPRETELGHGVGGLALGFGPREELVYPTHLPAVSVELRVPPVATSVYFPTDATAISKFAAALP